MIELKISCEPDALDAHMKALGFERQKYGGGMPEIAMPGPPVAGSSRLKFHGDDKSPIVTSTPETRKTYELEMVRRYVEAYGRQDPWVLDVIPDDVLKLYDKLQFTSVKRSMKFSELLDEWKKDPEFLKELKALSAEEWATKAAAIAENGTLEQQGQLVMTGLMAAGRTAKVAPDDVAATEAVRAEQAAVDPVVEAIKPVGRKRRIDPQDAADEAAETEATKGDKLKLDDVRAAFKRYSDLVGTAVAVVQIRSILGSPIAEIPETHEALSAAIAKIDAAIARGKQPDKLTAFVEEVKTEALGAGGLFGVDEPKATEPEPVSAEPPKQARFFASLQNMPVQKKAKADASLAVKAYALKFDGRDDNLDLMPSTTADMPRILSALFEGVRTPKDIPQTEEAFGKVCSAFQIALTTNPFERTALR